MNPVASIWIASLAGALLFAAAGFLWGRLRGWADASATSMAFAAAPPIAPPMPMGEVLFASKTEDSAAEVRTLKTELTSARAEIERLVECEKKIKVLEHARADLEQQRSTLARRASDADALRAKVDELTQRLTAAERRCNDAEKLRGAEESRRELAIEAEVLKARLQDADHVRDENAVLRAASRESTLLRAKVRDLEERLAGNAPDPERTIRLPLTAVPPLGKEAGDGPARFREVLDSLGRHETVRAATVADDLGFPVETIGDHAEALAALSGYLVEVANKARQLLPLSAVRRIVVIDDDETTVTTSRYLTEYGPLALVTLSEGPCPDWESTARVSGSRPVAEKESKTATTAK